MATKEKLLFSELTGHADEIEFDKQSVERSIAHRFAAQVARRGDAFAIKDAAQIISYSRLDALSNQIANRLLEHHGNEPTRVGLLFPLTAESAAACLGVWKAGKICVPIDPVFPAERACAMLKDARADVIITADSHLRVAEKLCGAAPITEVRAMCTGMSQDHPSVRATADDPAALIYVPDPSGSPRGIVHTHRSLLHRCWADTQYFQITMRDRISQLVSPAFGTGITQMLAALLNGASLHPFDHGQRSFEELFEWLWSERITIFHPSVPVFRQFLDSCPVGERYDDCRFVIQSGAPTLTTTVDAWRSHFPPDCALVCQLTSTEAQVISRYSIAHEQQVEGRYVPAGYADCDKQLSIVDSFGDRIERGAIGELVVSSRYMAAGTWCSERASAVDFAGMTDTDTANGVRSLRTNDLVSIDDRGRLKHHYRSDSAIKLRGYRIEVAEIERALREHAAVADSICVTRELENHRWQLVAFFVPADAADKPTDTELRSWLRSRIPDYMLPARFICVFELPRTINGKIARRGVVNLEIVKRSRGTDLHTFENELQRRFVEIWREAIGHEDVGIDDDFFDIGGDSLTALQVSAAISRCIGRTVPAAMIIKLRNIRRLVDHLDRTEQPITCVTLLTGNSASRARRPLFCIEGIYQYRALAEALGPEQELIGVVARPETHLLRTCSAGGRSSGQPAGVWPPSVEQLAKTYLEEIRQIQRSGPWQLAGAGFGGVIAFEMAKQLTAIGEQVSLLAMFDSHAPRSVRSLTMRAWLLKAAQWVQNSIPMGMPDPRAERSEREAHLAQSHAIALMRYKPSPWHGNVVLFQAADSGVAPGTMLAPNHGWTGLVAGQLATHSVRTSSAAILRDPAAQDVADTLRPFLNARYVTSS